MRLNRREAEFARPSRDAAPQATSKKMPREARHKWRLGGERRQNFIVMPVYKLDSVHVLLLTPGDIVQSLLTL